MARPKKSDRTSDTQIRDRIQKEAERLFAKKGFTSTTTREIAKAARVNNALIHYYFKGKAELYKAIITQNVDQVFKAILSGLEHDLSIESAIDVIVESYYSLFDQKSTILPPMLARELADGASFIKSIVAEKYDTIIPIYERAIRTSNVQTEQLLSLMFIIGIILFSILSRPIQIALREKLGLPTPDPDDVKRYIKLFVKQGIIL